MTSRPTTMVESDQLALAAANILKTEDFVPKGRRWPFSKSSKAHRDYDKAVEEITTRRRASRERAVEERLKKERDAADASFARATSGAVAEHDEKLEEARKPYDERDESARRERDAAIAAANRAYQEALEGAKQGFQHATATLSQKRDAAIADAKTAHTDVCAAIEAKRTAELTHIAREMRTIPLEGPMRVVEDRESYRVEERKKALIGLVDMAGREDFDAEYTDLCLRNVAGYVFQDRFLKPEAQQHRLMEAYLLEALVELARRTPAKRPITVRYLHEIVTHNPGYSSPAFIKGLTELYVIASDDTSTVYTADPSENEVIFQRMREQIADALKLTPRRSHIPPPSADAPSANASAAPGTAAPAAAAPTDAEITAEVDIRDLVPVETAEAVSAAADAIVPEPAPAPSKTRPPPTPSARRGKRAPVSEDST